MDTKEHLDLTVNEIEDIRKKIKVLQKQLEAKCKRRDMLLLELNKDNLKDPAWLFKNPTMPGVHEAIEELIDKHYGGKYNGPNPSGYIHDDKYKPLQQNFDFWLKSYDKPVKDERKKNCDHFIENFLPLLDAVSEVEGRWSNEFPTMKVVPFQFRSESSGLDYLGYNPEDKSWYHYTMRYGSADVDRKFKSWDEAFDFAYELANHEEDDNDY